MPAMTETELAEAIVQRHFGAVTVDTNIFDKFGCNLDMRALLALGPLASQHGVKLIFSDIVAGEVQSHISRSAAEQAEKLRSAINQYRKAWRRPEGLDVLAGPIDLNADPGALASEEWEAYAGNVGAEIVEADGLADVGELVRRYFAGQAPFSASAGKKAEFPDAIALLTLEAWAENEDCFVLAISQDGDWRTYAETSARLVCTPDFAGALDLFNTAGRTLVDGLIQRLRSDQAPDLKREIDLELEAWLSDADFEIEARADFHYDAQPESAVVQDWTIVSEPKVLALEGEDVTFSLEIDCLIAFSANFALSVWDGVDGDYVSLNSQTEEVEENHKVIMTVRVDRRFAPEPDVVEVEANRRRLLADFGYVGLDWGYEE